MPTPFGPQLIGETEKTLNALLQRFLEPTGLTEPEWVTLRLARQLDGEVDADGLQLALTDQAYFTNAEDLVEHLTTRGLLDDGRLTPSGNEIAAGVQARITEVAGSIWEGLPDADVASAASVLNEIITRARQVLGLPQNRE
ncbi:MAG TPA: hypothetical protein VFZ97_13070 [Acidimicrobiales bacterium]